LARAGASGEAGRVRGDGAGGDIDGAGAGDGSGAGAITGAVAGGAASARALGGSNSIVYSRTSRPLDQVASTITSTNGSSTARSLLTRSTWRPSGRRTICTLVDGSTALYSTPAAR
jgi:hypothetical protein